MLELDDSACALANFATSEKGLIWDQKVDLRLVPNAQDARAATAFFDPSISKLYAGKTMVASLFPVRALAMDKRFCHVKNIMKKYRKTLLHAFSELRPVVLTIRQKRHIFFVLSEWLYLMNVILQFIGGDMHQINDYNVQILLV